MPLSLPVIPMTLAEFSAMPHRLGWKHEYWDGAARLSPKASAVVEFRRAVAAPIVVRPRRDLLVRPIERSDADALADLFQASFDSAIEFAGYSDAMLGQRAQESMAEFFAPQRGRFEAGQRAGRPCEWPGTSFVAESAGQIIGAAMIREVRAGPILEPIFIRPDSLREGVGGLLLASALGALKSAKTFEGAAVDVLYSRCHLGNPVSFAWHTRHGFEEVPNLPAAQHRWQHYLQQAHALKLQGNVAAASAAQAEADRLAQQIADLESSDDPFVWGLVSE